MQTGWTGGQAMEQVRSVSEPVSSNTLDTLGTMQIELIYGMRSTIYMIRQEAVESGTAILAGVAAGGSAGGSAGG